MEWCQFFGPLLNPEELLIDLLKNSWSWRMKMTQIGARKWVDTSICQVPVTGQTYLVEQSGKLFKVQLGTTQFN